MILRVLGFYLDLCDMRSNGDQPSFGRRNPIPDLERLPSVTDFVSRARQPGSSLKHAEKHMFGWQSQVGNFDIDAF